MAKPDKFKHYKVHYPDGRVADFSLHRSASFELAESIIKRLLSLTNPKTGEIMKPVKVKRYK